MLHNDGAPTALIGGVFPFVVVLLWLYPDFTWIMFLTFVPTYKYLKGKLLFP